jgi:hypothetical protein
MTRFKYNNGSPPKPLYIHDLSSIFEKEMQRQIITSLSKEETLGKKSKKGNLALNSHLNTKKPERMTWPCTYLLEQNP